MLVIVILLLMLAGVFMIPSVQVKAAQKGASWFNKKFSQSLSIERFQYHFPNEISLENVLLPDHKGDTLFYVGSLELSFKAYAQLSRSLYLNHVEMSDAYCYLITQNGDTTSNLSVFINSLSGDGPKDPNRSFNLKIADIDLENGRFYLANRNEPDRIQFHWRHANTNLNSFLLAGKDVSATIESIQFDDGEEFSVQNGKGQFLYGPKGLVVNGLELTTGRGHLAGELTFITSSATNYSSFVDSVHMLGAIEYAAVVAEDIRYFSDAYPQFPTALVKGRFDGTVNDLYLEDLEIEALSHLEARGDLHLTKTTSGVNLHLETQKLYLQGQAEEAKQIIGMFQDSLPEIIDRLGLIQWQGAYNGGVYDFVTQSSFKSDLADMELNIQIGNLRNPQSLIYKGMVDASRINIAALTGNFGDFKTAELDLELDGKGFDPLTMRSKVKGAIHHFYYNGYRYQGMAVNGQIAESNFKGQFRIKDPNLSFLFDGIASFGTDSSEYDFTAQVDSANLYALHLVKDSLAQYRGAMDIDVLILDQDHWAGTVDLFDLKYRNSSQTYDLMDVAIEASGLQEEKQLRVRSDILEANLEGQYTYLGMSRIFSHHFKKYLIPERYRDTLQSPVNFSYDLTFKNSLALSQALIPELLIEPGTHVQGEYRDGENLLRMNLNSDGIRYGANLFQNLDLQWLSGAADLLNLTLERYQYGEGRHIDSIQFVNVFAGDSMNYSLDMILRDSIDSYGSFEGLIAILDSNAYRMQFDRGDMLFGNRSFKLDTGSVMRVDSSGFSIDWLKISGPSLALTAAGYISKDPNQILRLNVRGLDLDFLNYFQESRKAFIQGNLEGNIIATELLTNPRFEADIEVDSLQLNQVHMGRLDLRSDYSYDDSKINIDALLKLGELEMLNANGFYDSQGIGNIDLTFKFNRFYLAALDPFAAPVAENLRGQASGTVTMKGPARKPDIKGEFLLPKAGLTISFLQTDYNLVGQPKLLLDNESIRFPNLKLVDANHNVGYLNGEVRHRAFKDFYIDLNIDAQQLLVLNTGPDREDAYYGTALASGNLKVQGPPSRVKVYADVRSERGTQFNIPIGGATEVKQSGFVNFIAPEDSEVGLKILNTQFALDEGVSLDFDMDITPNAQVSIILNESTGNQLDGKGSGLIKMKLEPNRDLELFGTYTVDEGEYKFNIDGLFAKNFEVQRGGTVVWNGDPYAARLDLTAIYRTKANPSILTGESNGISTAVDIYLFIKGELTNPEINFAIELPRATSSTQAVLANRLTTDQAINQQVFSLLAFNSFTPPSNFVDGTRNAINQWDLIAGQAAAFLNRFTGDYELSLSYQPANQGQDPTTAGNSQEELEVGVSKNFFEDRLTVNSSVEVPLNENNNSIAGDFELIYKLTEDGKVRAKAFNRSVDNNLNFNIGQQQLYQQGLGLSFKIDFNTYKELWQRALRSAKREDKPEVLEEDPELMGPQTIKP